MALQNLNHLLVLAGDLEATRDFYVTVLGLKVGARPPFAFPGTWLYLGDRAVVHLAKRPGGEKADGLSGRGTGPIDHVAFEAAGLEAMLERLERLGIPARHRKVPGLGLHQLFIRDPNGVTIELSYPSSEGAGLDG